MILDYNANLQASLFLSNYTEQRVHHKNIKLSKYIKMGKNPNLRQVIAYKLGQRKLLMTSKCCEIMLL